MLLLKSITSDRSVDSASSPKTRFLPKRLGRLHFHFASRVFHPNTRIYVRLLGPCFQTGQWKPFRQNHEDTNSIPQQYHAISPTHQWCPSKLTQQVTATMGVSCQFPRSSPPYRLRTITETEETPRFLPFPRFSPAKRIDFDSLWTTGPTH
jgi:hypothetical protein